MYVEVNGGDAGQTSEEPWEYCSLCTIDARTGGILTERNLGYPYFLLPIYSKSAFALFSFTGRKNRRSRIFWRSCASEEYSTW